MIFPFRMLRGDGAFHLEIKGYLFGAPKKPWICSRSSDFWDQLIQTGLRDRAQPLRPYEITLQEIS
jgi:hypothetical protein